ncbi:polysaccharide deacetylase family protein [Agrobacterium sp. Ap1]|uniref:polysaccharide deacetylase family protein n=1 Tax=Agrobacterium sp. Ap1 TaxID=2815337 RepID=UPI001A8FD8D3|nr:polysaccharide deacetylase family protein [Agrobacterium sp. Ap1]MBO0140507.1 polysaccharide deacetylase family protein [Agrobacterium sp. Ap1]
MKDKAKAIWRRNVKRWLIGAGLEASALMAGAGLLTSARGSGVIFTLHHVRPESASVIGPNRHLEITPEFLDAAIVRLKSLGYDFIALSDLPERLAAPSTKPFAAFTLDDGYRNNAEHALPVFARHGVPFTVFIAQGLAEHRQPLWWEIMGRLLREQDRISFDFGRGVETVDLKTPVQQLDTSFRFASYVWARKEAEAVADLCLLAERYGIDPLATTRELIMGPQELRDFAAHPLVSLGAHTVTHRKLSRLGAEEALREMHKSAEWLTELTGERPTAIAYPYGSRDAIGPREFQSARDLGFVIGLTTQPGMLTAADLARPTALPRVSLNGYYQKARYVSALASGIPFALKR